MTFFADLNVTPRTLNSGHEIGLPVRYSNSSAMVGHFPAPLKLVRSLLPSSNLSPVCFLPGTAIVSVAAMQYSEVSDVQPYDEVSIMIPVQYRPTINVPGLPLLFHNWFSTFGFYIVHLPVSTQEACDFGIEVWGYPKFVADFAFSESDSTRTCQLCQDGDEILTLSVAKSSVSSCRKSYHTYTVKDDRLLFTKVATEEQSVTKRLRGGASLSWGNHSLTEPLRRLDVKPRCVEYSYAPRANSILFEHDREFELS